MPILTLYNLCLFTPIGNYGSTLFSLHIKSRQRYEVIRSHLDKSNRTAFEGYGKIATVVNLLVGYVGNGTVYRVYLLAPVCKHKLVDKMNTPVKYHSAAVLLRASPIGRNTS